MGSASQLVVIKPSQRESPPIPESVDEVPYFNGDHLLVAAALGGGNTISFLVGTLQSWLEELNAVERPDFQDLYEKVMQAALKKLDTTLQVDPRVWGERHAPDARGKVWNVRPDNVSVGDMGSAMVRGVVENLLDMMTPHLLHKVCEQHNAVCHCIVVYTSIGSDKYTIVTSLPFSGGESVGYWTDTSKTQNIS